MSVIIDTTMSEVESLIRYARVGANNCMIANSWEVTDLVRCEECNHWDDVPITDEKPDHECHLFDGNKNKIIIATPSDWFCPMGERRTEE